MEGAVAGDHGAAGLMTPPVIARSDSDEAIHVSTRGDMDCFASLAMTAGVARTCYRTTPELNPALRRGGLISFFRKQCGSRPA